MPRQTSTKTRQKILFDYYKQAAEKIVSEEEKYEKEISVCKERVAQLSQEFAKAKTRQD